MAKTVGLPPLSHDFKGGTANLVSWSKEVTDRMKVYSGTANPTAAQIPVGQWIVYRNTTIPETRLWVNWNGVLMSTAALT